MKNFLYVYPNFNFQNLIFSALIFLTKNALKLHIYIYIYIYIYIHII